MMDTLSPIETLRLRLRCVEDRDAESLSALMTPSVSRWVASWPSPLPIEQALTLIARAREAAFQRKALPMVVERIADAVVLGWIAVNTSPENGGFLGYWLGEHFHGRGYMREAAPPTVAAAFQRLNVGLIEAGVQLGNAPSIRVLEACGMRYVGERMVYASARGQKERCAWYESLPPIRPRA